MTSDEQEDKAVQKQYCKLLLITGPSEHTYPVWGRSKSEGCDLGNQKQARITNDYLKTKEQRKGLAVLSKNLW